MNKDFGVIFDMDGVLVDSNPAHKKSTQILCEKYSKQISEEYLREQVYGKRNEEWIPEVFDDATLEQTIQLADEKEKIFRDMFSPSEAMISGLVDFLATLREHSIKTAVATSAPKENAEYILSKLSIQQYFDNVLNSSHVDKGKPDPEIYLKTAKSLHLPSENCVIFEDSFAGIKAGLRANACVIGIASTHTPKELKGCHCHKVINDFNEIRPYHLIDLLISVKSKFEFKK